jgi:hypothetical protein
MSSIPNSAIPHAKPADAEPQTAEAHSLFGNLLAIAAAPALITLGLSMLAVSRLAKRFGGERHARSPQPTISPPTSA